MHIDSYCCNGHIEVTNYNSDIHKLNQDAGKLKREMDAIKNSLYDENLLKIIKRSVELGHLNVYIRAYGSVVIEDSRTNESVEINLLERKQ